MKNAIMFYYDFLEPSIYRWQQKIYIRNKKEKYLFQPIYSEKEIMEIYNLVRNNTKYYEFVLNKFNNLITIYNGNKYVLLKINKEDRNYQEELFTKEYIPISKYNINRDDWYFLWTKKNDYFEYQINHIYGKYPLIDESIDYFLGMAETAISYLKYNHIKAENNTKDLTICHKRIIPEDFYNPVNLVIDTKERDIGEYLKYIFYNKEYNDQKILHIINSYSFSKDGYYRLYARLLYPSYYFDTYEGIINENIKEEKLRPIIERIDEYEIFLNKIYNIISKKMEIKKIDWLQKNK